MTLVGRRGRVRTVSLQLPGQLGLHRHGLHSFDFRQRGRQTYSNSSQQHPEINRVLVP